ERSEPGIMGRRLAALRQELEKGMPVATALELSTPEIPSRSISLLAAAQRIGRLPRVLHRLLHEHPDLTPDEATNAAFYRFYPAVMLLVISGAMSMITVFVLPQYARIFRNFGIELPPITQQTYRIAELVGPVLIVLIVGGVLYWAGRSLWAMFHPGRINLPALVRIRDQVLWRVPIARQLQRDRGLADAFEVTAEALRAG